MWRFLLSAFDSVGFAEVATAAPKLEFSKELQPIGSFSVEYSGDVMEKLFLDYLNLIISRSSLKRLELNLGLMTLIEDFQFLIRWRSV